MATHGPPALVGRTVAYGDASLPARVYQTTLWGPEVADDADANPMFLLSFSPEAANLPVAPSDRHELSMIPDEHPFSRVTDGFLSKLLPLFASPFSRSTTLHCRETTGFRRLITETRDMPKSSGGAKFVYDGVLYVHYIHALSPGDVPSALSAFSTPLKKSAVLLLVRDDTATFNLKSDDNVHIATFPGKLSALTLYTTMTELAARVDGDLLKTARLVSTGLTITLPHKTRYATFVDKAPTTYDQFASVGVGGGEAKTVLVSTFPVSSGFRMILLSSERPEQVDYLPYATRHTSEPVCVELDVDGEECTKIIPLDCRTDPILEAVHGIYSEVLMDCVVADNPSVRFFQSLVPLLGAAAKDLPPDYATREMVDAIDNILAVLSSTQLSLRYKAIRYMLDEHLTHYARDPSTSPWTEQVYRRYKQVYELVTPRSCAQHDVIEATKVLSGAARYGQPWTPHSPSPEQVSTRAPGLTRFVSSSVHPL